jgi:hypothetical protein
VLAATLAAAAMSVTRVGALASIPTRADVDKLPIPRSNRSNRTVDRSRAVAKKGTFLFRVDRAVAGALTARFAIRYAGRSMVAVHHHAHPSFHGHRPAECSVN